MAAITAGRLAALLAAFVFVPLVVLSGGTAGPAAVFSLLAAALPSLLALTMAGRGRPDAAIDVAAATLGAVALLALLTGAASSGLALLAAAALAEAMLHGRGGRRGPALAVLAVAGAVGIASPFLPGEAGISAGRIEMAIALSALVAAAHGAVTLYFASRRMALREAEPAAPAVAEDMLMLLADVALRVDASGRALAVGANAQAALGVAAADLNGRGLAGHVHVADRPLLLKAISDVACGGDRTEVKIRLRDAGEAEEAPRYGWVACRVLPAERAGEAMLVLRDIAALEAEVVALREESALRQAALHNRGLFVSSLSHEVRTPLNAVIGFSDMLSNPQVGPLTEEAVREYARIINQGGQQLLHLVTATIDLIRLDSGTYELNPAAFNPADLIDGCVEAVSEAAEAKAIRVIRHLPPFLPDLTTDRRALWQALVHVLGNAVKFSPEGAQVALEVRARDGRLAVTVSDDGPGIEPEHLACIGDPFFQGDGSYDRAVSGAGMGLALVKRLLDVLGGTLRIESRLGMGTRVNIEVPLVFGVAVEPAVPENGVVARLERRPALDCDMKRRSA